MLDSISLFRIIKAGMTNFVRNLWLSGTATMVMTITLVIFSILFILFGITNYSIKTIQNTVDISVYFKIGLNEQQIVKIKQDLEADPKVVTPVEYVSAAEALQKFKMNHQNDPTITQSLNELTDNPLPASLHVKAKNLDDYPAISEKLQSTEYQDFISKVNFEDNRAIIERLGKILRFIVTFGIGLVAIFSLIAILVIFNTITLTIYNRKEEVEIMRLVGATNWYIRGPFLTEALLYSICATAIGALLLVPVFTRVIPKIALFVNPQLTLFNQNLFNYWYLVGLMLLVSVALAVFSTLLAIRKYLKI